MKHLTLTKNLLLLLAVAMVFAFAGVDVSAAQPAQEVQFTTSDYDSGRAIQTALNQQADSSTQSERLTVTLTPGTYSITEPLIVYSNTTIVATGATIKYTRTLGDTGRVPLISNDCSGKGGYSGASNITIQGGVWDFQGKNNQANDGVTMEAFRFAHGSNFEITDVTMQNLYESHYITIEGVENVTIRNCTFKDMQNIDAAKEAIHIDIMHNDQMAPSNQANPIYDDTCCNNITVSGCTFSKVPRGVGTHIAVAGIYPSNINITDNQFSDITYEAIKAYHYKNVTISGNTINNAGCGIKYYLYVDDTVDKDDDDEEGSSSYVQALSGTKTEGVPSNLNAVIENNTISNITSKSNGFAIQVAGNSDRIMNGVTVSNNKADTTTLAGMYVNYGNNIKFSGNTINASSQTGLLISNSSAVTASDNTITNAKENGLIAQQSKKVTISANTVKNSAKHNIYLNATPNSSVRKNQVSKDKTGGICADAGCTKVQITDNTIADSGKNAIALLSSKASLIRNNKITNAKNFGIFATKANQLKVQKNQVTTTKNTAIVVEKSTGAKIVGNTVKAAGNYGILFNQTVKSSGSNNKITGSKNYDLNYSNNSKNKKSNLKFQRISASAGKTAVTGHTTVGLTVSVTVAGKTKTQKTKPNGDFSIAVAKLKKGTRITLQVKDSLNNVATKNITVK